MRKINSWQLTVFLTIIFFAGFIRFFQLGFSEFYGDEIKTFYLDKTIPASKFFLSQRKGPGQFAVVWISEKLIGTHHELYTRLPFALAGFLSMVAFHLIATSLLPFNAAVVSTVLYAFSGFSIAFSRTVQYQSFVLMFSLFALWLVIKYADRFALLAGIIFGISFLFHYDTLFYFLPALFIVSGNTLPFKERMRARSSEQEDTLSFRPEYLIFKKSYLKLIIPVILIGSLFYIPYFTTGSYENFANYFSRRMTGNESAKNSSLYTINFYNPTGVLTLILFVTMLYLIYSKETRERQLFAWFFLVFLFLGTIVINPGTHILNYLIPLYLGFGYLCKFLLEKYSNYYKYIWIVLIYFIFTQLIIYIPAFKMHYPWVNDITADYQIFKYGFPYHNDWKQVAEYFKGKRDVKYYTNDNTVISTYYLKGHSVTKDGSNYMPMYYVKTKYPQEITSLDLTNYQVVFTTSHGTEIHKLVETAASN